MFCKNCGATCADDVQFCPNCGATLSEQEAHVYENAPAPKSPAQGLAIASLVCALAGFICCCSPTAVAAIVLGFMARAKDKSNKLATVGLVIGIISLVLSVIGLVLILATGVLGSVFTAIGASTPSYYYY